MINKAASNWLTLKNDPAQETAQRIMTCYGNVIRKNPKAWLHRLPKKLIIEIEKLL